MFLIGTSRATAITTRRPRPVGLREIPFEGVCHRRGVARRHDSAADPFGHEIAHTPDIGRNDGQSAGHRFEDDVGRIVEVGREREHVGGPIEQRQFALRDRAGERHGIGQTALGRPSAQRRALRTIADDEQVRVRKASAHLRHRLDQQPEVL